MSAAAAQLQAQNLYLQEEIKSVHNFDEIIGASAKLLKVLEGVQRVAPTDATVLVCGETGTGKELIARAVYSASRRADKPFIKLNCAALPAGLVESELFGHERGAFSGAVHRRTGRFELANHGTIFLDEIGEMPLEVQAKFLRVLQEQEFERVGSSQTIKVDVRVVAASNRDLAKAVRAGEFRQDLYYRLNVFPLILPALRDRAEDIPLLIKFFIQKYAPRVGRRIESIDSKTVQRLVAYPWPGNIRELENLIERALILTDSEVLQVGPDILGATSALRGPKDYVVEPSPPATESGVTESNGQPESAEASTLVAVQREHILQVLQATGWVIEGERGAAVRLGTKPATLARHGTLSCTRGLRKRSSVDFAGSSAKSSRSSPLRRTVSSRVRVGHHLATRDSPSIAPLFNVSIEKLPLTWTVRALRPVDSASGVDGPLADPGIVGRKLTESGTHQPR